MIDLTATAEVRHGYTLDHLRKLARITVAKSFARAADYHDRYDAAWGGIVEALYAADEPPTDRDLIGAGLHTLGQYTAAENREHGINTNRDDHRSPNFERYWWYATRPHPSPEAGCVERLSLWQVCVELSGREQQLVLALAAHDDYRNAAAAVDLPYPSYVSYMSKIRRKFASILLDGETPRGAWGADRRTGIGSGRRMIPAIRTLRARRTAAVA